eukprot:8622967-Alexandrium_andersonii.AAC.1
MSASLVGSEMCIRDRACRARGVAPRIPRFELEAPPGGEGWEAVGRWWGTCLLYTSDAADDM